MRLSSSNDVAGAGLGVAMREASISVLGGALARDDRLGECLGGTEGGSGSTSREAGGEETGRIGAVLELGGIGGSFFVVAVEPGRLVGVTGRFGFTVGALNCCLPC